MTIAHVESSEDLNLLVQELEEHSDEESMGIVEEFESLRVVAYALPFDLK